MDVVFNPYQSKAKKVLCVCSRGILRSPTLANILHKELGYNTRAVGASSEFALIPMSEVLVAWADEIVFVDDDCKIYMDVEDREMINDHGAEVTTLNIPDNYDWHDKELEQICLQQYIMT